jgi:hypothetical protein
VSLIDIIINIEDSTIDSFTNSLNLENTIVLSDINIKNCYAWLYTHQKLSYAR